MIASIPTQRWKHVPVRWPSRRCIRFCITTSCALSVTWRKRLTCFFDRLEGADANTVRAVMNLAASMSPANTWTPALDGATIRNLYPGRSAFQGILAVELQRCGFTGLRDAPSDVYGTILADRFEPELAVAGIEELSRGGSGAVYRIEQNYFKLHACCRFNHFALDAVMALRRAHRLTSDEVEKVEIVTLPFAVRMGDPAPVSPLESIFGSMDADAESSASLNRGMAQMLQQISPELAEALQGAWMVNLLAREPRLTLMPFHLRVH